MFPNVIRSVNTIRLFFWLLVIAICQYVMMPPKQSVAVEPPVSALEFEPEGNQLLVGSQSGVRILAWPSLKAMGRVNVQLGQVHDLAFSPDGKWLVAAGGSAGEIGQAEIWSWPEQAKVASVKVGDDVAFAVAWSRDSSRFICGCSSNHLVIVQVSDQSQTRILGHSKSVFGVASLPNDLGWLSAGADRSLRWWRRSDADKKRAGEMNAPRRTLNNHTGEVLSLAVRPGNAQIPMAATVGKDDTVRLWQPTIGRLVRFVRLPIRPLSVCWTPSGERLGVSCMNGHFVLIDPNSVEILQNEPAVASWGYSLAAAPDGKSFVVGGPNGEVKRIAIR